MSLYLLLGFDKALSLWLTGKVETSDVSLTKAKVYKHADIIKGEFKIGHSMEICTKVKRTTHEVTKKEYEELQLKRKARKTQTQVG